MPSVLHDTSRADRLLNGIRVLNAGTGFVAAVAAKLLGDLGADVISLDLPDHEPVVRHYPALKYLRANPFPADDVRDGIRKVDNIDVCIIGGEDFPGVTRNDDEAREVITALPNAIVLDVRGFPASVDDPSRAVEILVQARSGLVYEHYLDRPNLMTFQPAQFGAALQGVIGVLAALYARGLGAAGQVVETSLYQGALAWVTTWNLAEKPEPNFQFTTPMDPRPLILPCRKGEYIHIVFGSNNAKYATYQVLGIDDPCVKLGDSGAPNLNDPPEQFYGNTELLKQYAKDWDRDELVAALTREGVAAAKVHEPGVAWRDPQVIHLGIVDTAPDGTRFVGRTIRQAIPGKAAAPKAEANSDLPLAGIRIVDFGAFTAGPVSSMILRKLGAEVVKVEPLRGDPARNLPRAFMAANRGKKSLALDMKKAEGKELVDRICATADVVCTNFRTGVAAKLGIDGATLIARHPRMIILETPAFGQTGPRSKEGAFDLVLQAMCGFEVRAGGTGNQPIWNRTFLADYAGGMLGAIGVLAALVHRQGNGRGALVEASLLDAAFFLQSDTIQRPDGAFSGCEVLNSHQTGVHPAECLYQAKGGWLAIAVRCEAAARALGDVLGLSVLSDDWRNWTDKDHDLIAAAMATRDLEPLLAALAENGVWAARCEREMEARTLTDASLLEVGIVEKARNPHYGYVSQIGRLFSLSESSLVPPEMSPELGEHNQEILSEIGVDAASLQGLIDNKVVK